MIHIRTATDADWPVLEKLNKVIDYNNPKTFMLESIEAQRVLVAEVDGSVVGYALWQILWGNTPVLSLAKVFPVHQQKGVGSTLITELEERIKTAGFTHYLSSTMQENSDGQAFHSKLGFNNIGVLSMEHGEEIFYKKHLT